MGTTRISGYISLLFFLFILTPQWGGKPFTTETRGHGENQDKLLATDLPN